MKQLSSAQVRQMWLDFWATKGHSVEPSVSLVPVNDPTLLWINSGVATLKKYFDGTIIPENPRITNAQKAIRTNDIENVGKTARHHTSLKCWGNFSIGDYFRDEAITWAYELLTSPEWFDFPAEKLYMTYYPDDKDSYNRWIEVGVDPSHLIPIEDNFWEIGAGPSGPDTEIFFDRGEAFDPENIGIRLLAEDIENDRYIEIWNIVLSQFNADPTVPRSEYKELPHKNIDTGAGLERLVAVIQGAKTNFETDLFMPIIREVEKLSGKVYDQDGDNMSFKVIADHIRSLSFAIGDGALPGNEVVVMSFVVSFVVLLCTVKNWVSTSLSFTNSFQLLEKSWKATTQKCLKNVTLSKKSLRARKNHLRVLFTQVNTLPKAL